MHAYLYIALIKGFFYRFCFTLRKSNATPEGIFKAVAEFYRMEEYSAEFAASYLGMTVAEFLEKVSRYEEEESEKK